MLAFRQTRIKFCRHPAITLTDCHHLLLDVPCRYMRMKRGVLADGFAAP
jgi:hypothetical protein